MGPAFDIPQHLLLVLLAASAAGGNLATSDQPQFGAAVVQQESVGDEGAYRFAAASFLDALSGLKGDPRFKRYATRVFKTSSGYVYVPVLAERREMLALRRDPVVARHVAADYARANAKKLEQALRRPPSLAELYLAHRLGLGLAIEFTTRLAATPRATAVVALPEIDDAAPDLVFAGERPRTLGEIAHAADRAVARAAEAAGASIVASRSVEQDARSDPPPGRRIAASGRARIMGWGVDVDRAGR